MRGPSRGRARAVAGEEGNPFGQAELMSTDVGKAKSFFGKLFDWELEDMPIGDMTYTMIRVGEGTGGGAIAPAGDQTGRITGLGCVAVGR